YTGDLLTQSSTIRIELTQELPAGNANQELQTNPFRFKPEIKGTAHRVNSRTVEFVPAKGALKAGQAYKASFKLDDFVEVPDRLKEFTFGFRVQKPNFTLSSDPIVVTAAQPDKATVTGTLSFSHAVTKEQTEKMLLATGNDGKSFAATLTSMDDGLRYRFEIAQIPKGDKEYRLRLSADGASIGANDVLTKEVIIPEKGAFRYLSAKRIDQPENGVEMVFSEPVSTVQDLKGLIEITQIPSAVMQVKDNRVRMYFDSHKQADITLRIDAGLKNYRDTPLGASLSVPIEAVNLFPQVQLPGQAAILPDTDHPVIGFKAVNLYAVDLNVVRIYEQNIPMFLQSNNLKGSYELRRSGRLVYKKTLRLDADPTKDIHRWEDYTVDLGGVMKQEPNAIYRLYLSFKQAYSAYPCDGDTPNPPPATGDNQGLVKSADSGISAEENAAWDKSEAYYYYSTLDGIDWSVYNWRERNNPCHPSYYMLSEREAACNVFATHIGLIVKRNSQNKLWVAATNLNTTQPLGGTKLTAYNYQLLPVGEATTDGDGLAVIATTGKPFLVVAEADKQKSYVRVVDGEEQSTSRFDVGGKEVQQGLKGYIYGERGVWRPGDTLHISFILEDREQRIPDRHPVMLEAYNPQGQFYAKLVQTDGLNGFYTFALPTRADDLTGTWNLYVKVGGSSFHKSVHIETIKPNRLKIAMQLPEEVVQADRRTMPVTLTSSWLTGATAANLKAKVEASLSKVNTQFKNYDKYTFNNPLSDFTQTKESIYEGTLDATGQTRFDWKLPAGTSAPGMLNASLIARVYEPGGDASIYTQTVPYSPFASYVGVNLNMPANSHYLETDRDHTFDVVTLSPAGTPVNRTGLEYTLYKIDWSWWWNHGSESMASYVNNSSVKPVAQGKLQTTGGKGSITFRVNYPDWGRYLVLVKDTQSGHAAGGTVYMDWPDWRGRAGRGDPENIKMLTFSMDKPSYEAGERATAIIPAAAGGRALVSIENGSTVLKSEWVEVSNKGDTKYTFTVTPEMAPNVYLHIVLLQPYAQTTNDLPIRMYGVQPVAVTDKQTELHPTIEMPDVLRPETDFDITVKEKDGKPMTYTLAVVDDGLLDLTSFKTPDPWSEFYAREALGIRMWDMYDDVLGAFAGRYNPMFSTGGDETLKPADEKANRFKPVVKFIGPFALAKGAKQTHRLRLPMYVGSVRTMVVAGGNGAYGHAEKSAYVRTPLMLLSTLPRVLSIGEEITVPVNVFAMEQGVKSANVAIKVTGADTQVSGASQQTVTFAQPGDQMVYFALKTGMRTGKVTVQFTATGGGQQATEQIEIEVRNPNPPVTLRQSKWVDAGKSVALNYSLTGGVPTENRAVLEVSRMPSVDITRRMDFLYNYRYNCTEQITSKVLPLLYIAKFKELDADETAAVRSNVEEGIRQLYGRQLADGSFVYWPGDAVANEWITSYAGMFLVLAGENGYTVNSGVLEKWKRFQRNAVQNWRTPVLQETRQGLYDQSFLRQAFRLYTLALASAPEQGAMNRMKELAQLPLQARWTLAAAYAVTGKPDAAGELVYQAPQVAPPYPRGLYTDYTYGSRLRDNALILQALLHMNREQEAMQLAKTLSEQLSEEQSFTSQSTAFALMAMGELAGKLSGALDFTWTSDGKQQPEVKSAKALFTQALPVESGKGTVQVTNQGTGSISVDVVTHMQPLNDTLPARSWGSLFVAVEYVDLNGAPLNVDSLKQGTDFVAKVRLTNISPSENRQNLALTYILPSGWEIFNERMTGTAAAAEGYSYRDIRDDRVFIYFDLPSPQSITFDIRLQATYIGDYTLPAVTCEAMYDASVQARTTARRTKVVR
ncbi:MAG: alpha-2-macroglobulin, partial [Mediterranea sp.]|nr:alpha-2-macroglobulin [Mediterranea sp.]